MMKWQKVSTAAACAALLFGTAACGGYSASSEAQAADPAPAPAGASGDLGEVTVWEDTEFGPLLIDDEGFTLYRFDEDTADPPASNCDGGCAEAWPPVPANGLSAGTDIDSSLLGRVTRSDGTEQLTVAGWPAYRFASDNGPRQVTGHGVGDVWFAIAPDGARAPLDGQDDPNSGNGGNAKDGQDGYGADDGYGGGADETAVQEPLPTLSVVRNERIGPIVRDGQGRTLYRFTEDSAWPMESNCTGDCLDQWKPAPALDAEALKNIEGIDPELVITFDRPDGTQQLTIDCWPLYWFTGDQNPGDISGHGVGDKWFAVTADGSLVED